MSRISETLIYVLCILVKYFKLNGIMFNIKFD